VSIGKSKRKTAKEKKKNACCCCKKSYRFTWNCSCGFEICQECMSANLWGMTCNSLTWSCPDCGKILSF
jgi:hypothetical protein